MKINYKKNYENNGTVYNQTITIDKEFAKKFNRYILDIKYKINNKKSWSDEDLKIFCYLKMLEINTQFETLNYINLTTLDYFMKCYLTAIYEPPKRDKNFERIKWRNTIIKVL